MTGRYHVATFGCRVNQTDSAGIAGALSAGGLERTTDPNQADLIVLNTCTVTHRSDADVRKAVHRIKRENPQAQVIVTGCYAQRDPAQVEALGVGAVVGNGHKHRLPVLADQLLKTPPAQPLVVHSPMTENAPPVTPHATVVDRTRPFIKIQDGCDAACTYCVIPEVRGAARSAAPDDVLETAKALVDQGYFELVLTGVHLGTYRFGLAELVQRILDLRGLGRLRLSCIEPMAFPLGLADLAAAEPRLAPHFHLPLQSGCDRILKRMVRPYRAQDFRALIADIRKRVANACIGTDVIVGFPGEEEEEFQETVAFVETVGVDYVHVFSYSDREGTPSTRLEGKVDPRHIKLRSRTLHQVAERLWHRFLEAQVGKILPAVTLEPDRHDPSQVTALTENYCQVRVPSTGLAPNESRLVEVLHRRGDGLVGAIAC